MNRDNIDDPQAVLEQLRVQNALLRYSLTSIEAICTATTARRLGAASLAREAALTARAEAAERERDRLRKLFDDAGQGEHNVLALIDHYQGLALEAQEAAQLESVHAAELERRARVLLAMCQDAQRGVRETVGTRWFARAIDALAELLPASTSARRGSLPCVYCHGTGAECTRCEGTGTQPEGAIGETTRRIRERQRGYEAVTPDAAASAIARGDFVACPEPAPQPKREPVAVEPDPSMPVEVAALPDAWDARRRAQGKPDLSRCAAELRRALEQGRLECAECGANLVCEYDSKHVATKGPNP